MVDKGGLESGRVLISGGLTGKTLLYFIFKCFRLIGFRFLTTSAVYNYMSSIIRVLIHSWNQPY